MIHGPCKRVYLFYFFVNYRSQSTLGDCQSYRGEGVESEVLQETPSQNNDTHYDSIDQKKLEEWSDDKFGKADLGMIKFCSLETYSRRA